MARKKRRAIAVHFLVNDSAKCWIEWIQNACAYTFMRNGDTRRGNQRIANLLMPKHSNNVGHKVQNAASALELIQACPILRKPLEELRVDRIGEAQQLQVTRLFGVGRKFCGILLVEIVECLDAFVARPLGLGIERLK